MSSEKTSPANINALAAEVMDLWQEHLQIYATDPAAKAELMKMLEPQRQLFADWTAMMQNGLHGPSAEKTTGSTEETSNNEQGAPAAKPHGPAPAATASDDGALRLAQLAYRLAELEKRIAKLESRASRTDGGAAKTARRGKAH